MQNSEQRTGVPYFAKRRPSWALPDVDAVHNLRLSKTECLNTQTAAERKQCPECGQRRAMFCYDCLIPLMDLPRVTLPIKFCIVTHHAEKPSMSTRSQAAILAPDDVTLNEVTELPADLNPERTVVLFPSDDALTVQQLEPGSVDAAIVIDSKWRKAVELNKHAALSGMRRVKLENTRSAFWRFHTAGVTEEGVCTVESMLHLLRAMVQHGKLSDEQLRRHQQQATNEDSKANTTPDSKAQLTPETTTRGESAECQTQHQPKSSSEQGGDVHDDECNGTGERQPASNEPGGDAYHAYDDLLWLFVLQHKHIQERAAKREASWRTNGEPNNGPQAKRVKHETSENEAQT